MDGTNPKFVVTDDQDVKWKAKLGQEARPETVASRLIWAVGYLASEDYFLRELTVQDLPPHLHRGQRFITASNSVHNVRLKRYLKDEDDTGTWAWADGRFRGTREENGLRVLMALIGDWDLSDDNNSVYRDRLADGSFGQLYMVRDLGSCMGAGRLTWHLGRSRGNLDLYRHSRFITKVREGYVYFYTPSAPALFFLATPREYLKKLRLRWIGTHIPRDDAKWTGQLLSRLSPAQIRDAFRSADYSPDDIEAFAQIVELRIRQLVVL